MYNPSINYTAKLGNTIFEIWNFNSNKLSLKDIISIIAHVSIPGCHSRPLPMRVFLGFFPPASLLFLPSTREGRGGGRGKDNRSSADVTSDCAGCVALGTQSLAPLLSCVCVCVFPVSPILLFPKEGVLWTKHTRNVRATVPGNWIITLQSPWLWPSMSSKSAYLQMYAIYKVGRGGHNAEDWQVAFWRH